MSRTIKEIALEEAKKYEASYLAYCKETGNIMMGDAMKQDAMEKASFCEDVKELEAMKTYYKIGMRQMEEKNTPHGFKFSRDAMITLINIIKNE